jgi:hypothetical protein
LIGSPLALERFFIAFPRSPGGMVSGRRPMPEVVYFGYGNRHDANRSSNAFASIRSRVLWPSVNH